MASLLNISTFDYDRHFISRYIDCHTWIILRLKHVSRFIFNNGIVCGMFPGMSCLMGILYPSFRWGNMRCRMLGWRHCTDHNNNLKSTADHLFYFCYFILFLLFYFIYFILFILFIILFYFYYFILFIILFYFYYFILFIILFYFIYLFYLLFYSYYFILFLLYCRPFILFYL
jgi:hypothetical protein